jgi:hypothetical protein
VQFILLKKPGKQALSLPFTSINIWLVDFRDIAFP